MQAMIILSMSLAIQGRQRQVLPPVNPVPEGYELLTDSTGESLRDVNGELIYVLIASVLEPAGFELLRDRQGDAITDANGENIYVLKTQ